MNRRKSIKALILGATVSGVFVEACKNADKKITDGSTVSPFLGDDRMLEEKEYYKKVIADTFFNEHEMKTIAVLSDIIIPKDAVSGSATEAKVPEFIEFIVKDMPGHQIPVRGGLKWLDIYCLKVYEKTFIELITQQQIEVIDLIAYPKKAKPELMQGVAFFNKMRDLVVTGFYTSEMGVKDLGYVGNTPNQWNGVPDDVLKRYGLSYTEKELKECVSFNKA